MPNRQGLATLILTVDEIDLLASALAQSVEPDSPTGLSAMEASATIWRSRNASSLHKSLATALSESVMNLAP